MATIKIPYLVQKGRTWHWQPGKALRNRGWKNLALGTNQAAAEAEARRLNAEAQGKSEPRQLRGPMTVRDLIVRWQQSPRFTGKRTATKADYAYRCRVVDEWCGDTQLDDLTRGLVEDWHLTTHARHGQKANRALQMLRTLYDFAIAHEWHHTNPADKIKPLKTTPQPVQDWTPDQIAHMTAVADSHVDGKRCPFFSVGTAIMLNEWLGQRPKDVLLMDAGQINDGVWNLVQSKTKQQLFLPVAMVPGLTDRIAEQQERNRNGRFAGTRIIVSEATGQPYITDEDDMSKHFTRRFQRVRKIAAESMPSCRGLTFQKLRSYAATSVEDAGGTEGQLNSVGGWRDRSTASSRYRRRTLQQAEGAFQARLAAFGSPAGN